MDSLSVKGVTCRIDGMTPTALAYLRQKLGRINRRERSRNHPLQWLIRTFFPKDYAYLHLESMVEGRILVVGCSAGIETLAIQGIGIDIDLPALRIAAELGSRAQGVTARFLAACGSAIPFGDASFDCLLGDNFIEHLPPGIVIRHLKEALRVLRPGGRYVFTSPNRLFEVPAHEGHTSLHSFAEWEALLAEAGFREVRTPRRRSGALVDLSWKKNREEAAARSPFKPGISHQGIRIVTIIARR